MDSVNSWDYTNFIMTQNTERRRNLRKGGEDLIQTKVIDKYIKT